MKVTLNWLQEYVNIKVPLDVVCDRLTMAGLEVADVKIMGGWKNVVVGQIVNVKPHPNADKLRLATVNLGDKEQTVVCGAPNLYINDKIAFAFLGAQLRDGHTGQLITLKPAKIRGVLSEGMICSEKELDISDDHTKIMVLPPDAPLGIPLAEYLGDTVLDIEVTPNRPDCLSVIGIAREIAALTNGEFRLPNFEYKESERPIDEFMSIQIVEPELCPRYCATLLTDVEIAPSPLWMQRRLLACGMRPINNIVDVTNYVMLEYGQPLHAFDYDEINDKRIIVRRAKDNEIMVTLDGIERKLQNDMLVIADGKGAVAVAGIMGGEHSEVTENTTRVLIESANFNQAVIHRGSLNIKLSSEASSRFEKGLSPELPVVALKRATQLMQELSGAKVAKGIIDVYPVSRKKVSIPLSTREVKRILGIDVDYHKMIECLRSLGFGCEKVSSVSDEASFTIPWWRTDVTCSADLVEEVARVIGYDNIPMTVLSSSLPTGEISLLLSFKDKIKEIMVSCGMQEVLTYSLTNMESMRKTSFDEQYYGPSPLKVANPMSKEFDSLRTELRSGLLMTLARNQRFQQKNVKIFELGKVYMPKNDDLPEEKDILCGLISAEQELLYWGGKQEKVDFYIAKGLVETLLLKFGLNANYEISNDVSFLADRCANVIIGKENVGVVGELHHKVIRAFDISDSVYLFELDVNRLFKFVEPTYTFNPPPKYPSVTRDIALIVDETVPYQKIYNLIKSFSLVSKAILFDLYRGEQIPKDKKSFAFRIIYQSYDHTLTDEEVERVQQKILDQLAKGFNAYLRT